jgi:hypothetical protein
MSTKGFLATAFLALLSLPLHCVGAEAMGVPTANEWQTNTYPEIGLRIQLPQWKAVINDQATRWFLSAHQVEEEDPVPANRYRVMVSVEKVPYEEYEKLYRIYGTNAPEHWGNSAHPRTDQRTNQFWIAIRRDVYGTNGFVYRCDGAIRRSPKLEPERLNAIGGTDEKVTAEMCRVIANIEVVYSKPAAIR